MCHCGWLGRNYLEYLAFGILTYKAILTVPLWFLKTFTVRNSNSIGGSWRVNWCPDYFNTSIYWHSSAKNKGISQIKTPAPKLTSSIAYISGHDLTYLHHNIITQVFGNMVHTRTPYHVFSRTGYNLIRAIQQRHRPSYNQVYSFFSYFGTKCIFSRIYTISTIIVAW